jgi:hypothetical protein
MSNVIRFKRFFSMDSAKAIKAQSFGYLNAINYMAPHKMAGVGNLCGNASPGCIALCLGWYSGQAGIVANDQGAAVGKNAARASRHAKAVMFMRDRKTFMNEMIAGIEAAERKATREGLKLCVRLNGASDIAWEGIRHADGVETPLKGTVARNIFNAFPHIQFVDYTKNVRRALKHARGEMPANYHLTFSRSETNEAECKLVLAAGGNVAVVFAGEFPQTYLGRPVIDGDQSDLRHLDKRGGNIVALTPKGTKAKADQSGFVLRLAA